MKFRRLVRPLVASPSLPVRGAWIEISVRAPQGHCASCRSPCGERGLKFLRQINHVAVCIVAPRAGSVD